MNPSKQLFSNPVLEKLTRTNALVVITTLVLLSLAVFIYGVFAVHIIFLTKVVYGVIGLLSFTLAEYLIHRFVFHSIEYSEKITWQFRIHGIHHAFPSDKERLAMPLPLAIFLSAFLFFLLRFAIGSTAFFFFPGFLLGYACYLLVHYIIHTRRPPNNICRILWKHHYMHHFKDHHKAYGVTTPFWDIVFGTMPSKTSKRGDQAPV